MSKAAYINLLSPEDRLLVDEMRSQVSHIDAEYNYPEDFVPDSFIVEFNIKDHTGRVSEIITEDAEFEIIEPKQLPDATTGNS